MVILCPNRSEWKQSATNMGCKYPKIYHCLKDETGNPMETCLEKTWIQPGFCPEFNTHAQQIDVSLCKESLGKCPTITYWSDENYRFSACFPIQRLPSPTLTSVLEVNSTAEMHTTTKVAMANGLVQEPSSSMNNSIIVLVTVVSVLLTVLICLVIVHLVRRHRQKFSKGPAFTPVPTIAETSTCNKEERIDIPRKSSTSYHVT